MWVQAVTDTDDHDLAIQIMAARSESIIIGLSLREASRLVSILMESKEPSLGLREALREAIMVF